MSAVTTEALSPEHVELRDWLVQEAETRGNAVMTVAPEGSSGGYCFTVGAWRTHGVPEAVVIGLPEEFACVLLDAYVDRAANGERFEVGELYHDIFENIPITFEEVARGHYPPYFGACFLLYPDGNFPAVQIIVPTPDGHWPWSGSAPSGFGLWQRVLTESGLPESWTPGADGP